MKHKKVNKDEFLRNISKKSNVDIELVDAVYEALVDEIRTSLCAGKDVSLIRFGTFSVRDHKGHPVQFKTETDAVSDYMVLKFKVSDVFIKQIRENRLLVKEV